MQFTYLFRLVCRGVEQSHVCACNFVEGGRTTKMTVSYLMCNIVCVCNVRCNVLQCYFYDDVKTLLTAAREKLIVENVNFSLNDKTQTRYADLEDVTVDKYMTSFQPQFSANDFVLT